MGLPPRTISLQSASISDQRHHSLGGISGSPEYVPPIALFPHAPLIRRIHTALEHRPNSHSAASLFLTMGPLRCVQKACTVATTIRIFQLDLSLLAPS